MSLSIPTIARRSSRHQNREARLVQDGPCDPTKHPLAQLGLTIGTHDEEVGAKSHCLRQQKVTHPLSIGRQTLYLYLRAESRQAACDVRPRLLTVTLSLALIVNDQDLYSSCARKQGHSIRYGPDGLARGVPTYENAADPRCHASWWKEDDWPTGTQYQGFREARRVGHLAALRAGNNHEVCVVRRHGHLGAPVRQ